MSRKTLFVTTIVLGLAAGCTSYYRVTDPTTDKVYYTTDLKQDNGATTLKDGRTGDMLTLQNVQVRKISKEDYDVGRMTPPAAPAVAAPMTAAPPPAAPPAPASPTTEPAK